MADKAKPDTARDFASVMLELPDAHGQMGVELQGLIAAVRATGKAGALTLKLGVSLLPNNDAVLVIKPVITNSKPKFDVRAGTFYVDGENNPVRDDPNRFSMFNPEGGGGETVHEAAAPETPDAESLPGLDPATGEIHELPAGGDVA